MPNQVTCVGFTCPVCKRRVAVLSSSAPPPNDLVEYFETECECGYALRVGLAEIQSLETWKETPQSRLRHTGV